MRVGELYILIVAVVLLLLVILLGVCVWRNRTLETRYSSLLLYLTLSGSRSLALSVLLSLSLLSLSSEILVS